MSHLDKLEKLQQRMEALHIYERDLLEKFILGTGSGGQKVNKTSSCVFLKHLPSGIQIKCQKFRSRERNRLEALEELCDRLEKARQQEKQAKLAAKEKKRRQTRRRSKTAQELVLKEKKTHSQKKRLRRINKVESD